VYEYSDRIGSVESFVGIVNFPRNIVTYFNKVGSIIFVDIRQWCKGVFDLVWV
jgi:hypothetical protein